MNFFPGIPAPQKSFAFGNLTPPLTKLALNFPSSLTESYNTLWLLITISDFWNLREARPCENLRECVKTYKNYLINNLRLKHIDNTLEILLPRILSRSLLVHCTTVFYLHFSKDIAVIEKVNEYSTLRVFHCCFSIDYRNILRSRIRMNRLGLVFLSLKDNRMISSFSCNYFIVNEYFFENKTQFLEI